MTNLPIDLSIEKLVFQGWGLGYCDGQAIFVPNTIPGDTVRLTHTYRRKRTTFGTVDTLIQPSPLRNKSLCHHYPTCGGCQLIHVNYTDQLELKQAMLTDLIQQLDPQFAYTPEVIVPVQHTQFFRNKMDFSFATHADKTVYLGLKERGRFDRVHPVPDCQLASSHMATLLSRVSQWATDHQLSTWDYHAHTGILRHLVVRESKTQGGFLLMLSVSEPIPTLLTELAHTLSVGDLTQTLPIRGLVQSVHAEASDHSLAMDTSLIAGSPIITETILNTTFKIAINAFFQTNTHQAEVLFQTLLDVAEFKPSDRVLDLYCGAGTIGLLVAPHVQHVIGIESIPEAIENAKQNAVDNGITNCEFYAGRVKNLLKFNRYDPDVIIVDPPRSGLVPKALNRLIEQDPHTILYISCNPSTLLRDLRVIQESGYRVVRFVPVDMFPHSFHLECVVKLCKEQ
ncbi:MAG: 23S rRNA (uracil(1939)-C(5))-methyltransferase RlmD [Candidatus Marinamargulisbacteria bacterium]|nr:23S rRNA (uracil(1939)-C(5))-methyltransferase RlmD [Candidatus Marinamargulisbacteria bacterium]